MNECDRFPEGSTHRAVCCGEVRTLEHCNFHRARWGLAPLESLPVRSVSVAPDPQKPAPPRQAPESVGPCPHRGGVLRVATCDLCGCGLGKGKPFNVLACAKFGECSLDRYRRDVRSCRVCLATGEDA